MGAHNYSTGHAYKRFDFGDHVFLVIQRGFTSLLRWAAEFFTERREHWQVIDCNIGHDCVGSYHIVIPLSEESEFHEEFEAFLINSAVLEVVGIARGI